MRMAQETHDSENLDVFRRFLATKPFPVDPATARLESPPKPDGSCSRNGRLWYFELVRPVNPGIAEYSSQLQRAAQHSPEGMASGQAFAAPMGVGFVEAVEKKARKTYELGGAFLDLLIWIDRRADFTIALSWPHVREPLRDSVARHVGRWHTVWVFDPVDGHVLDSIAGGA